jgi:hypothetical protein
MQPERSGLQTQAISRDRIRSMRPRLNFSLSYGFVGFPAA